MHGEAVIGRFAGSGDPSRNGGMSCPAAEGRFGVSPSSAIRFVREWRESGSTRAKPQGGDQRSHRIEAHRELILSAIEAKLI
jgi:transposase